MGSGTTLSWLRFRHAESLGVFTMHIRSWDNWVSTNSACGQFAIRSDFSIIGKVRQWSDSMAAVKVLFQLLLEFLR